MIASLRGLLRHKDTEGAVVDCGGVGFAVSMSLTALSRLGESGARVDVLVHTHVTQDSLRLYGFVDPAEREAFTILIGAPGVGPRLALAVLSLLSPGELSQAVATGDKATLVRIPGVGAKKAERLLVELKGRLAPAATPARQQGAAALANDLVSALANLGFPPPTAEKAARHAIESHSAETDLTVLVREALRATTRRAG